MGILVILLLVEPLAGVDLTIDTVAALFAFLASEDARAREIRRGCVFRFTPMVDVDGCFEGKVRFNAHGYDVNRHWDEVDLRNKELLRLMPEIWRALADSGRTWASTDVNWIPRNGSPSRNSTASAYRSHIPRYAHGTAK